MQIRAIAISIPATKQVVNIIDACDRMTQSCRGILASSCHQCPTTRFCIIRSIGWLSGWSATANHRGEVGVSRTDIELVQFGVTVADARATVSSLTSVATKDIERVAIRKRRMVVGAWRVYRTRYIEQRPCPCFYSFVMSIRVRERDSTE